MNTFIKNLLSFSLKNRFFVLFATIALVIGGVIAYKTTIIEAFPDVTNTQVTIITQWPGRGAEEIEKFVTIPIEVSVNGVPNKVSLRSTTLFGLSVVKIIFEDDVDDFTARQTTVNLLANADLPDGVKPEVQPPYGPTGEIFRYTLKSTTHDVRELKTLQDWVVERRIRAVSGVADVVSFGGEVRTFEISVNPDLLLKYDISPLEVYNAVNRSNINVGGDVIEKNDQAYVVRGIGLHTSIPDIENVIVDYIGGVPITVRNLATVHESALPRLGQVGRGADTDVVEGIVVMRKGEDPSAVISALEAKIDEINTKVLPDDVRIVEFYNRQNLIDFCIETVSHNIVEGIILVTVIVFLFLADFRATFIVAIIIPLALLFAFICLKLKGLTANLLSIGAIDFGIIIDGAVVMVEGVFVALDAKAKELGMERFNKISKLGLIKRTGIDLGKSIFFAKVIIITSLIPLFSFTKVEGRMFKPLAYTLSFALVGALILSLTLVPVLISLMMKKNVRERHNPIVHFITSTLMKWFDWIVHHRKKSLGVAAVFVICGMLSFTFLGSEFLPQLNEGAMYIRANLPLSTSLEEAVRLTQGMRETLRSFPEVKQVMSQTGRPNDGTDPTGFYNVEFHVDLLRAKEWSRPITKEELIAEMKQKLSVYPGINFNFSQPIMDNVEEAVSGVKGSIAVKVFGDDLQALEAHAEDVYDQLKTVRGIEDLGIIRNMGQPELRITLDEGKMATYGVATADANSVIEMAIGGKAASRFYDGEKKFDIRVRYLKQYRDNETKIADLKVPTLHGSMIPLKEIANITSVTGPLLIFRDGNERFIAIKFSVRGRDMGSTIGEAQAKVNSTVKLEHGMRMTWTGDFENQQRAEHTLSIAVPVSLVMIFIILLVTTGTVRDAFLIILNVPFAIIGGIGGLLITGTNFSISAGIGFIALSGICILNGVILVSIFHKNMHDERMSLSDAIRSGVSNRIRPIVMTAFMGILGLLPAAMSTGIGSDAQRPLAIVVVSGFVTTTLLSLLIFPQLFWVAYRKHHLSLKMESTEI